MDFIDELHALAARASKQVDKISTEEATKNALVMPFINALGYNVFDPAEVTPELSADVGVKKGEKVDYAILKDSAPIMLFECKCAGTNLDRITPTQLFRYFVVTDARIGVLTNGVIYRFFSDLEQANKMDTKPFLEFNLFDFNESIATELKKLTKATFDESAILSAANDLKYTREIKRILGDQLSAPSDEFVRLFVSEVYSGKMITQKVREQFKPIVQRAFRVFINDQITDRLKTAMAQDGEAAQQPPASPQPAPEVESASEVVTTEEELEGYYAVKSVLRESVDPARIAARDVRSYFGILLDDNNRKPLCRLRFDGKNKYIGLFDRGKNAEDRVRLTCIDDIYKLADRLKATLLAYEGTTVG